MGLPMRKDPPEFIEVEGHRLWVPLRRMRVGSSIFVPCLTPAHGRKPFEAICKEFSVKFAYRERIENDLVGIRVWRVL